MNSIRTLSTGALLACTGFGPISAVCNSCYGSCRWRDRFKATRETPTHSTDAMVRQAIEPGLVELPRVYTTKVYQQKCGAAYQHGSRTCGPGRSVYGTVSYGSKTLLGSVIVLQNQMLGISQKMKGIQSKSRIKQGGVCRGYPPKPSRLRLANTCRIQESLQMVPKSSAGEDR